ncbi:MAG: tetratricopeptide repeat protein, partial [Proteobacteria bacterium]|nr:tetratricopeptide repeat protein [Pseudomonadota bacterium]
MNRRYSKAVGPKLYKLLVFVFVLVGVLLANSMYLASVTLIEWVTEQSIQNEFYLLMFFAHLIIGIVLILPFIVYGLIHLKNSRNLSNKKAIIAGYSLFISSIILLISGLLLTRGIPFLEVKHNQWRQVIYWLHLLIPVLVIWLFVFHRLAGRSINFKPSRWVFLIFIGLMATMLYYQLTYTDEVTSDSAPFEPSLSQTFSGDYIDAKLLNNSDYCQECHADVHETWQSSMHKFSSFNNISYAFSINNTKKVLNQRDGHSDSARFCAACHDPVLFYSGQFDNISIEQQKSPDAQAGITCSSCHAISHINSVKGNGAFTMRAPVPYPFTYSDNDLLQWINRILIKGKPDFHKQTYLKPFHKTSEFCSTCHKVSIPEQLNHYKWLRGQNHYDSFFLSGVSGHSVSSFYYPPKAKENCAECHMTLLPSDDFGAISSSFSDQGMMHDHAFSVANTAIRYLNGFGMTDKSIEFLKDSVLVDIFAIKTDAQLNGEVIGPIKNQPVELTAGNSYLLETLLKTVKLGHSFTEGTVDSNQIWVELSVYHEGKLLMQSGGVDKVGTVDRFAYFVNAYVLDKNGNRIDERNAEDIFTALYNHGIPPGAAAVLHYQLDIPEELSGQLTVEAKLHYRKFDHQYYQKFSNKDFAINDLPVVTISSDKLTINIKESCFPARTSVCKAASLDSMLSSARPSGSLPLTNQVGGSLDSTDKNSEILSDKNDWKRWNDYGIALFRSGAFKQAEHAFEQVVQLNRAEGWVNLARTWIKQGLLDKAAMALDKASAMGDFKYPWQLNYFSGLINYQNGQVKAAIDDFRKVLSGEYIEAQQAGFDFSKDYRFITLIAQAYMQMSKLDENNDEYWLKEAESSYKQVLEMNPEWPEAYYGLSQLSVFKGETKQAKLYAELHKKYKVDDNAHDRAI